MLSSVDGRPPSSLFTATTPAADSLSRRGGAMVNVSGSLWSTTGGAVVVFAALVRRRERQADRRRHSTLLLLLARPPLPAAAPQEPTRALQLPPCVRDVTRVSQRLEDRAPRDQRRRNLGAQFFLLSSNRPPPPPIAFSTSSSLDLDLPSSLFLVRTGLATASSPPLLPRSFSPPSPTRPLAH